MAQENHHAVSAKRQETSEEGLGWPMLLQNEGDTLSFAGVSASRA